jgi:1,4-dihydroxy-2-naphthoyl-CoA synthase
MTTKLLLEKDGALGWIIFNQPEKRNAVSQEMWQAMAEYVEEIEKDDAIRVVILRGAGDHFRLRRGHLAVQGSAQERGGRGRVPRASPAAAATRSRICRSPCSP